MNRTLLITGIAIVVLSGLGVLAYFFIFADDPGITVESGGTTSLPLADPTRPITTGQGSGGAVPNISSPGSPVAVTSRLVEISKGPVVPGEAVTVTRTGTASTTTTTATVTYIERQSGNVFSYLTSTKTLTRINNKTLPGIQSAVWLPDASVALVRYLSGDDLSTVNTYALSASSSQGFFLAQNLSSVAVSPTSILTIASGVNGSVASLERLDGTRASTPFTTPLTSLRASFAGKNQYLVFSKPSASLLGNAFLVNPSGYFSRVAGPLFGLSALASPSGKWLLVSFAENGTMRTALVDTSSGKVIPLPLATITDKCVWASDETSLYCGVPVNPPLASYPDDWYQGAVQFSDRLWKIYVTDRYAQMILDFPVTADTALDAQSLAIDSAHTTLVFMNKNDDSLWTFSL